MAEVSDAAGSPVDSGRADDPKSAETLGRWVPESDAFEPAAIAEAMPDGTEVDHVQDDCAARELDDGGQRAVVEAIGRLRESVEHIAERAQADQDVISRMQARIEALQADQVRALLGPVLTGLANLHAAFEEASSRDYDRLGYARVRKEFTLLGDRVESSIDLLGAASVGAAPGQQFDSRLHTAVRKVSTADPRLDKVIESVVRQGFVFENEARPALHARVTVFAYDQELARQFSAVEGDPTLDSGEGQHVGRDTA